jgi:hypothetical protein
VVTKPLVEFAVAGLQVVTTVGPVVTGVQVVAVHWFVESAMALVQEPDAVGPVKAVPGQRVVVQLLPALGDAAVQDEAPITPLSRIGQLVVV